MTGITERLRATTEAMANEARVPMGLWDRHSNACLEAASHIEGEQSRIDAAVKKERERCAGIARTRADTFTADASGDYRDGEHFAARDIEKAIRTPTPTTEEGA